ncbi:MAG: hypothetical protein JEY94_02045 [Melioribacteraceae bacterium]|nr:hypothetical protein [Melioribacteraceae bacterium]
MIKFIVFIILVPILLLIFALIYLPYKLKTLLGIRDKKGAAPNSNDRDVRNPNSVNKIKNEDIIEADFEELDSSDKE